MNRTQREARWSKLMERVPPEPEQIGQKVTLPPDPILRRLLSECNNAAAAHILGVQPKTLVSARVRLGVAVPWCSGPQSFLEAAGRVAQDRWIAWQERLPPPVSREELEALIEAEVEQRKPKPQSQPAEAPPGELTPGTVLVAVKRFYREQGRWPALTELPKIMRHPEDAIRHRVEVLRQRKWGLLEDGHVVLAEEIVNEAPVTTTTWSREQIEEHLISIGVLKPPKAPVITAPAPAAPEPPPPTNPDPPQEVDTDMTRPKGIQWPEPTELIRMAQEIADSGQPVMKTLAERFGCGQGAAGYKVKQAERLTRTQVRYTPNVHKARDGRAKVRGEQAPTFACPTCRDSGRIPEFGGWCSCDIGQREHERDLAAIRATAPGVVAAVAGSAPEQGVGTVQEADPPASLSGASVGPVDRPLQGETPGRLTPAQVEEFFTDTEEAAEHGSATVMPVLGQTGGESLEQVVKDLEAEVRDLNRRLTDTTLVLEVKNKDLARAMETIAEQRAALEIKDGLLRESTQFLEEGIRLLNTTHDPTGSFLLLAMDPAVIDTEIIPVALRPGDEWAQTVDVGDRRRVMVFHVAEVIEHPGWPRICVMRPGAAREVKEKGVA